MAPKIAVTGFGEIVRSDPSVWEIQTAGAGPRAAAPDRGRCCSRASGDIFGLTQNAGMGWDPREPARPQFLMLGTQGGIRAPDGRPIALGYHTGHWEIGLLMQAAAQELTALGALPFAGFCSDPCDGRTQGTPGMMDSLAYRNDAAVVLRRLARSLPTRRGVLGVATCDKGLPAMMMALAHRLTSLHPDARRRHVAMEEGEAQAGHKARRSLRTGDHLRRPPFGDVARAPRPVAAASSWHGGHGSGRRGGPGLVAPLGSVAVGTPIC
jgi:hypothetical protein